MNMNRISRIKIDDSAIPPASAVVIQERKVAIYDLLEENNFDLPGRDGQPAPSGPYALLLAIRDGRLVFVNAPLRRVAAALDRWTGGRTLILDDSLAARPVTLITRTTEAARGLERLAQATPMRIRRGGSLLAVVTSI